MISYSVLRYKRRYRRKGILINEVKQHHGRAKSLGDCYAKLNLTLYHHRTNLYRS